MARFLDSGRKSFGFSVSVEIDLVFVWVVDIDLISVWGSTSTFVHSRDRQFRDRKRFGLCMGVENDLV